MSLKLLILGVVFLLTLSIVKNGSAHNWLDIVKEQYIPVRKVPNYSYRRPYYQQQSPYKLQKYPQQVYLNSKKINKPNLDISVKEAEWICTNSKTNDMMIITASNAPLIQSNGQILWPSGSRPVTNRPIYPQSQSDINPQSQIQFNSQPKPATINNNFATIPVTTTTTVPSATTTEQLPIWPDIGDSNKVSSTTESHTGPTLNFEPATTKKPIKDVAWSDNSDKRLPGFTTEQSVTDDEYDPIDDDDAPIDIVLG